MALESPLFQSAMELFGHSITHFNGSEELDRKLVILHLANSVELIFKDILLDIGESIYKNPKETVTINSCMETLKARGIAIPYVNKLELLIDERNAIQHRFGSPNELTSIFYMTIVSDFFREIFKGHYKQDFDEVVAQFTKQKDLIAFRTRRPSNESELDNLRALSKFHPLGALLSAMSYLERRVDDFAQSIGLVAETRMRPASMLLSPQFFRRYGVDLPSVLDQQSDEVRQIRNAAAHGRRVPTKAEADKCISFVEEYEKALDQVDKELAKRKVKDIQDERARERQADDHRTRVSLRETPEAIMKIERPQPASQIVPIESKLIEE